MAEVKVDWNALRREWRKDRRQLRGVWVEVSGLRRAVDTEQVTAWLSQAVAAPQSSPCAPGNWGFAPAPTGNGFVVFLDGSESPKTPEAAIERLAASIADAGEIARIRLPDPAYLPGWLGSYDPPVRRLSLFASMTLADPTVGARRPDGTWGVEAARTRALVEDLSRWVDCASGTRRVRVELQTAFIADFADVQAVALHSLANGPTPVSLSRATRSPGSSREAHLSSQGLLELQIAQEPRDWRAEYADLREVLIRHAHAMDLGFIRNAVGGGRSGWADLTGSSPRLPGLEEWHVRYNQPLLASYVPDVNVIQVLTAAHLERANDLSPWLIEKLPDGRFLVEGSDPARWLDSEEPDPELVATARKSFGSMIMTAEFAESERLRRSYAVKPTHQRNA